MRRAAEALALAAWALLAVAALDVGPRWWIAHWGDPLDKASLVLRADARLGWRQRELWRGAFLGHRLETNELGLRDAPLERFRRAERRVLLLGPSSTFGWGVETSETYARRLEGALGGAASSSAATLNAGQIGYSAWQGLRFYDESGLRSLKPAAVVLAYGANDVDRFRFFSAPAGSDAAALGPGRPAAAVALQNSLRRAPLLALASRHLASWAARRTCAGVSAAASAGLRAPPEEFERALTGLARRARGDGAAVILATTASRYPAASTIDGGPEEAYARARAEAARGDCSAARAALLEAFRAEPGRLDRDLKSYNRIVRRVAAREGAALVDLEPLGSRADAASLFVDPIHFSGKGHVLVARLLFEALPPWLKTPDR